MAYDVLQLYFCEFCMSFFCHKRELTHHQQRQACARVLGPRVSVGAAMTGD
jgi:hypothetical protein